MSMSEIGGREGGRERRERVEEEERGTGVCTRRAQIPFYRGNRGSTLIREWIRHAPDWQTLAGPGTTLTCTFHRGYPS